MTATTLSRARPTSEPSTAARVWPSLARREAGFTLRHPLIWVGVLASAYVLWSFNRDQLPHLGGYSTYVGLGLAPLAGAALLVAHLQTSRAQRHGTLEIEDPAPAKQQARTLGHLVGSLALVPVAAGIVTAYIAYLYWLGGTGRPDIGELLVGPVVVAIAGVAGVAAGTWYPNRFSGLLSLGALAGVQIALQDAEGTRHWFAWWHTVLWHTNPDLWIRPTWVHVVYLAGVALVVGAIAMLRHGARPMPLLVVSVAAAGAVGAGAIQARPPSDSGVESRLAQASEPANEWVNVERGAAIYRVHPSYERWVGWWDTIVQDTTKMIPATARPSLVFEQWHSPYLSQLEEEFGYFTAEAETIQERGEEISVATGFFERLDDPWPVRTSTTIYLPQRDAVAIAVAQRAVGLPLLPVEMEGRPYTEEELAQFGQSSAVVTEEGGGEVIVESDDEPWWPGKEFGDPQPVAGDRITLQLACNAEGQSREVVAAWLAAQGSPDLADLYRRIRADGPAAAGGRGLGDAVVQYDVGDGPIPGVNWRTLGWIQAGSFGGVGSANAVLGSPTATDLAAQLLEHDQNELAAIVAERWDEWVNPATSVQVIIDTFDLEQPPTPSQWIEQGGLDPTEYAASIAAYPLSIGELEPIDQPYPVCP